MSAPAGNGSVRPFSQVRSGGGEGSRGRWCHASPARRQTMRTRQEHTPGTHRGKARGSDLRPLRPQVPRPVAPPSVVAVRHPQPDKPAGLDAGHQFLAGLVQPVPRDDRARPPGPVGPWVSAAACRGLIHGPGGVLNTPSSTLASRARAGSPGSGMHSIRARGARAGRHRRRPPGGKGGQEQSPSAGPAV
jgi:hypothetical protein